jgi:hypothetical protein
VNASGTVANAADAPIAPSATTTAGSAAAGDASSPPLPRRSATGPAPGAPAAAAGPRAPPARAEAAAAAAAAAAAGGASAPSWYWGPGDIKWAAINLRDPPSASPPPIPSSVLQAGEGLSYRTWMDPDAALGGAAAAAAAAAAGAAPAAAAKGKAPLNVSHCPFPLRLGGGPDPLCSSRVFALAQQGFFAAGRGSFARNAFSRHAHPPRPALPAPQATLATARRAPRAARAAKPPAGGGPITGASTGFDGIGVPETGLYPQDIGLAVGRAGAVHTSNGLIRFYGVAPKTGLKASASRADAAGSGSFLKQIWLPDFFYAVRLAAGIPARKMVFSSWRCLRGAAVWPPAPPHR